MSLSAIILAAGKATRMKSERVKVLHEVCGRPMLGYVLDAARAAGATQLYLVIGHDRQRVMETYKNEKDITWVIQEEQKGTGHAVMVCREAISRQMGGTLSGETFVLCGDGPMIRAATLEELLKTHRASQAAVTLATCILADPSGYGRILRDSQGNLARIVEQNDADAQQKAIQEVNPSYYLYQTAELFGALAQVQPNNKKGEYYLTDTLAILRSSGKRLAAVPAVPPEDVLSINSRSDLADVNRLMQQRIQKSVMDSGVTLVSPERTWIEFGASIGQDTLLEPFTWIGQGACIAPGSRIAAGTQVPPGTRIGA